MTYAIIDSDSICYANSLSVQTKEGGLIENAESIMCYQMDKFINNILTDVEASDCKLFLTGKGNFREKEFPSYKENRKGMERPFLLPEARQYLESQWNAIIIDNMEADDAVCIEYNLAEEMGLSPILCHLDKDLDQLAGRHYRWPFRRKPSVFYEVSELEGLQNLYQQALIGDKVDNIMFALDESTGTWKKDYGVGKVKARKLLEGLETEQEMYECVLNQYLTFTKKLSGGECTEQDLIDNMHMLYMVRKLKRDGSPVRWRKPNGRAIKTSA